MKFYMGIDASKGYADFIFLDEKKGVIEQNFQLDDSARGHKKLRSILKKFYHTHGDATIYAAIESTGGYENNWFKTIMELGKEFSIHIARLNPIGVNYNSKANLNRNTTDKISAVNIAEYLISHPEKVNYDQTMVLSPMRKKWSFMRLISKQKVQLINHLKATLYSLNPEILAYCKDGFSKWVFAVLLRYPTAEKLASATILDLTVIPYMRKNRAATLIQSAKNSVAASSYGEDIVVGLVKQIMNLEKIIDTTLNELKEELPENEAIEILISFPGISYFTAVGFLLEISSVDNFPDVKKLASFLGLHPVYKISGDGTSHMRMSKQGRKEARRLLYNVAMSAIVHNPIIKEIYEKFTKQGMAGKAALGVCMHKILRIMYGMLKNKQKFDPEIDRKNRRMKRTNRENNPLFNELNKTRRYQKFDSQSPISRRQTKKRKEWAVSQSDNKSLNTGSLNPTPPCAKLI